MTDTDRVICIVIAMLLFPLVPFPHNTYFPHIYILSCGFFLRTWRWRAFYWVGFILFLAFVLFVLEAPIVR